MTEPSEAAIGKACELLNRHLASHWWEPEHAPSSNVITAFAGFIDHVSGVAAGVDIRLTEAGYAPNSNTRLELSELILPGPDPLEELKHKPLSEALSILSERGLRLVVEAAR